MTKLKTLKDMSFYDDGDLQKPDIRKDYLKQVASEWIEKLTTNINLIKSESGIVIQGQIDQIFVMENTIDWIKHFFNLENE